MKYVENWEQTKRNFQSWWAREDFGRPLMRVVARREQPLEPLESISEPQNLQDQYLSAQRLVAQQRNHCRAHRFLADAFPSVSLNLGPGSMATYLGAEPVFAPDTVWYRECAEDIGELVDLDFDPSNPWWNIHRDVIARAVELARGDFPVAIPDIIENIDIVAAMRGPQALCYDLMDHPDLVQRAIDRVDELYFQYYDTFYDLTRDEQAGSVYTAFHIWGPGRTAKVQCDFSAMMSPRQFQQFIVPSLTRQVQRLRNSLYHLDGPDAIRHLDALMGIQRLDALQWTAGAGQPDGASEKWYPIYDKVRRAGKGLWVSIYDGDLEHWLRGADRLIDRLGSTGLYLIFPDMTMEQARRLLDHADRHWNRL